MSFQSVTFARNGNILKYISRIVRLIYSEEYLGGSIVLKNPHVIFFVLMFSILR